MNWLPSITIVLIFACLVAYEYIRDLRRDLKDSQAEAKRAWRLYDNTNRELCAIQGKPVPAPYFEEDRQPAKKSENEGFRPTGIGPTVINDRERRRTRQDEADREPRFANRAMLAHRSPSPDEIAAAARAATEDLAN